MIINQLSPRVLWWIDSLLNGNESIHHKGQRGVNSPQSVRRFYK